MHTFYRSNYIAAMKLYDSRTKLYLSSVKRKNDLHFSTPPPLLKYDLK